MKNQNSKINWVANANNPYSQSYSIATSNFLPVPFRAETEIEQEISLPSSCQPKTEILNRQRPGASHNSSKGTPGLKYANHFDSHCEYSLFSIKVRNKNSRIRRQYCNAQVLRFQIYSKYRFIMTKLIKLFLLIEIKIKSLFIYMENLNLNT